MAQIVPLTGAPNASLRVALSINGNVVTLNLTFSFNEVGGFWVMTIYDVNGNLLISSIPLLTGYWPASNILAPFEYYGIGSAYIIAQNAGVTPWPTSTDLNTQWILLWDDNNYYTAAV